MSEWRKRLRGAGMTRPLFVGAWLAILTAGCGTARMETAPVEGRVTLDGEPVPAGTVVFLADVGPSAKGMIRRDGTYQLGTYGTADGAVVGSHRVIVVADDPVALAAAKGPDDAVPSLVPLRYTAPSSSGLTHEVRPGRTNRADFDLTTATPAPAPRR